MTKRAPFRCFKISPEIIRLGVMLYIRFPLSLRNVEDLLHERAIEISHETLRFWWNRFGPMFASEIRRNRISRTRCLQKLASGHFSVHNHFYQERHLYSRDNFKLNQTTTLTEWRQLCSA
jgi:putative transposase